MPALVVFFGLAARQPSSPAPLWWTTHALVKIGPQDPVPASKSNAAEITAARNEFEPFQIVLRSAGRSLEGVDAEPFDLQGPDDAVIARQHVGIYFESYVTLKQSSNPEQEPGEWPDPLVPRVDQYAGERRNAFPFRVLAGRNQPIWVEVYVPPDAAPGEYTGQIRITAQGAAAVSVPVKLHVRNFSLPSTSSLKTSYGLSGANILKQHRGKYTSDDELRAITHLYAKAALWHRVSFHGGTFVPPPFARGLVEWSGYDKEVGPFLDGTALTKTEPLYGAKATSIDVRSNSDADTDEKKVEYLRAWVRHFEEKGWLDRLFLYVWDEPTRDDLPKVAEQAKLARQADPRLRVLLTTSYDAGLDELVDIWTPLINCVDPKPGFPQYCRTVLREGYEQTFKDGKSVWWYQSCASHGCKGPGGEYFQGWPSYLIDDSAVANRIMPWITWKYKMDGELYYNMTEAADPWNDTHLFGGNGDGTLFYPGTPARIGGRTDIPIESIRLKLIREGLEDYEYLALLSARGHSRRADELASALVRSAYDFQRDPQVLYSTRRALGEALEEAPAVSKTPPQPVGQ